MTSDNDSAFEDELERTSNCLIATVNSCRADEKGELTFSCCCVKMGKLRALGDHRKLQARRKENTVARYLTDV